jgi:hypothetical protein
VSFGLGKLLASRTTGTRLAVFLASRFYRSDYNVLLARFPLSFLIRASVHGLALLYSLVKVLLFFQLYHPTKGTIVK